MDAEDDDYHREGASEVPSNCDLCVLSDQRIFYIHHTTKKSYWEPPRVSWGCPFGFPYGWEQAIDSIGTPYFINHLDKTTTYDDPRQGVSGLSENGAATHEVREVEVERDAEIGFGFVAASEFPVMVQYVTVGGPSEGKLQVRDQLLKVNDVDAQDLPKDQVVQLIRASGDILRLSVTQMPRHTKNARSKKRCRVRFTDRVAVSSPESPSHLVPFIPNVMRVFLENGHTKSFKYDDSTTVQDVLEKLAEKLQLRCVENFALVLEHSYGARSSRISLLKPDQLVQSLGCRPNSSYMRCVLRVTFVPADPVTMHRECANSFAYYYQQCVNDVVGGRFAFEMRYEACLRLAALHVQQLAHDSGLVKSDGTISLRQMEKEYGLATFLPLILLENVKGKEIRKHLRFYLKKDSEQGNASHSKSPRSCVCAPPDPMICSESSIEAFFPDVQGTLGIRFKYVQIVGHLPSFGGRSFSVTLKDSLLDMIMQIDPRQGILVRHPGRAQPPTITIPFELLGSVSIENETDVLRCLSIALSNESGQILDFLLDKDDSDDLLLYIYGYYKLCEGKTLSYEVVDNVIDNYFEEPPAPPYRGIHSVNASTWSYSNSIGLGTEMLINFANDPPVYEQAIQATFFNAPQGSQPDLSYAEDGNEYSESETNPVVDESARSPSTGSRKSRLLQSTDSFLVRNKILSPQMPRDSIKLRKKRNSVPSEASTSSSLTIPKYARRYSSSSDTDNSLSLPRRRSRDDGASTDDDLGASSFGLSSPDQIPTIVPAIDIESLVGACHKKENLESLLLLFPDRICTDPELIDLTSCTPTEERRTFLEGTKAKDWPLHKSTMLAAGDRKQVRFAAATTALSPQSREPPPPSGQRGRDAPSSSNGALRGLTTSRSFPLEGSALVDHTVTMDAAIEEFLRRSNSISVTDQTPLLDVSKCQVRRMSLKEFTGLEESPERREAAAAAAAYALNFAQRHRIATGGHSPSLLQKCSSRRRSSSGADHSCHIPEAVDELQEDVSADVEEPPPEDADEAIDYDAIEAKLTEIRSRLSETMKELANQKSPVRSVTVVAEADKVALLNESRRLAAGCKHMVRAVSEGHPDQRSASTVHHVVESADRVTGAAETIIAKSGSSVFSAQLMTAKTEQMLNALADTVAHLRQAEGKDPFGSETKELIRSSTTLAATLTQLLAAARTMK
ncbi:hypothetical protein QR680_013412 [Steinernema hermaphroditum]|uniref:FERM and PDZ domain-containing protein 4 n=1 Tax=Steinernema hermaphroditum TaxID=289476 RepID=A0AA39I6S7_9BILA|nr:hypothetical protein QR680_013412 [Steinernema hermaphroditum]